CVLASRSPFGARPGWQKLDAVKPQPPRLYCPDVIGSGGYRCVRIDRLLAPRPSLGRLANARQRAGSRLNSSSRRRAIGEGTRCQYSQERSRAAETPSSRAKTAWLAPSRPRVARTAFASYSPGSSGSSTVRTVSGAGGAPPAIHASRNTFRTTSRFAPRGSPRGGRSDHGSHGWHG